MSQYNIVIVQAGIKASFYQKSVSIFSVEESEEQLVVSPEDEFFITELLQVASDEYML